MKTANAPLTIDVVTDLVCPWCYIGKRQLEAALALPAAAALGPVQMRWHPFQLNPELPPQGVPRQPYLEAKFGGASAAAAIYARVRAAGQAVGLSLQLDGIAQQPNTLAAHTLMAFAQLDGADGSELQERLLRAYFVEGRFIGSPEVLADIAAEAGLDRAAALAFVSDPAQRAAQAQADARIRQQGVRGVPFFVFNQRVAVSGAQAPQQLLNALQQALAAHE